MQLLLLVSGWLLVCQPCAAKLSATLHAPCALPATPLLGVGALLLAEANDCAAITLSAPARRRPQWSTQQPSALCHAPTFTNRLLYLMRLRARPLGVFFLSCFSTLAVWPFTLPARAKDPWTLPASPQRCQSRAQSFDIS